MQMGGERAAHAHRTRDTCAQGAFASEGRANDHRDALRDAHERHVASRMAVPAREPLVVARRLVAERKGSAARDVSFVDEVLEDVALVEAARHAW